jgi:hypothetical protein
MDNTIEKLADLYVWGLPLVIMHRTRALHCSWLGQGVLWHRKELATARDRTVVAPNNDTLYSTGWYDLSCGDLRLDVPPMDHPDRYWSVMLLDAFTHVAYVSRRLYGVNGASVVLTYDPSVEQNHAIAADKIAIGTPTVWVLGRTLVDGPEDLDQVGAIQEKITVTAPSNHPSDPTGGPPGRPDEVHTAGALFFDELRQALKIDPPADWHPRLTSEQQDLLDNGAASETLEAGVSLGHSRVQDMGSGFDKFKNGWGTRSNGTQFGDDINLRANCAQFTLAGHHRVENAAYGALQDKTGEPLDGSHPLTLHFPPEEEPSAKAFWSLTVYEPDMFFYDNPLDRHSIGDRTPGLKHNADGLKIIIGGNRPEDISNWLPAPAGPYRIHLRIYEGRQAVVDATWFPPSLRRS